MRLTNILMMDNPLDWNIVKSQVIEGRRSPSPSTEEDMGGRILLNNTDIGILGIVLDEKKVGIEDIKKKLTRSDIALNRSLKKLSMLSWIGRKGNVIYLGQGYAVDLLKDMRSSKFRLDYLVGKRMSLMISLLGWRSIQGVSTYIGVDERRTRRYLSEIEPMFEVSPSGSFRIDRNNKTLIHFLEYMASGRSDKAVFEIWSSGEERLLRSDKELDTDAFTLTSFSRFFDYGMGHTPGENYYYEPRRDLSLEEILIHSMKSSDNRDMFSLSVAFFLRYHEYMDHIKIEELAIKYEVMDLWLDMHAYIKDIEGCIHNRNMFITREEFLERFGMLPVIKETDLDYGEFSREAVFLHRLLSPKSDGIVDCEQMIKREKVNMRVVLKACIVQLKESADLPPDIVKNRLNSLENRVLSLKR